MTDETLFSQALETPSAERAAFLDAACAGDAARRKRIDLLLAAHNRDTGILDVSGVRPDSPDRPVYEKPGAVLAGRYKLLEEIGEGGMGSVWVAEQVQPVRRKVAVKLIKAGMDSQSVLARFEAERQALALMDHPNIAKVLDGGVTDAGRPFFVMEYVKGVPLTKYCDDARLPVADRLALFVPICHAVQHAHQKGIVHRDLKPSNILVCPYDGVPVPKVIDFGLAKAMHQPLTERTLHTAHGLMLGTPLYMSPEQAEVNNLDVDTRTDVYALGVILYELLTGSTPLERDRITRAAYDEMLRLIREEDPPRPSTRLSCSGSLPGVAAQRHTEPVRLTKLVRGELDWIVMKCLEKDRARRYETANGLARDLQRFLADEPVEAGPPSAAYRLRKVARRYRAPLAMAASVAVLLVGGVAVSTWQAVRAARAEARADEDRRAAVVAADEAKEQRDRAFAEKKRADEERAVAKAVSDFLQKDVLGQADIENQAGGGDAFRDPNLTVRTALDRAATAVPKKFAGHPLTEAAVRWTIAEAYKALGRFPDALGHIERCVELRTAILGPDHADTLTARDTLANLLHESGNVERARTQYREVLDRRTATLGPDHPDSLTSLHNLAYSDIDLGMPLRAIPLLRDVIGKRTTVLGPNDPATLATRQNLAWLTFLHDGKARSTAEIREIIATYRTAHGPDHPGLLDAQNILGLMNLIIGKPAEAEATFRTLLERRTALQGPTHIATIACKKELAKSLVRGPRPEDGVRMLEEVLAESNDRFGPGHPLTTFVVHELGDAYGATGQSKKTRPMYETHLARMREKGVLEGPAALQMYASLARAHLAAGDAAAAVAPMKEYVDGQRTRMGAENVYFANLVVQVGREFMAQRCGPLAEPYLREGLAILREKRPGESGTWVAESLLGGALLGQKKYDEAETSLLAAYGALKSRGESMRPVLARVADNLVRLYTERMNPSEAAKWKAERATYPVTDPPRGP